jgi:hypothetical protein
MTRRRCGLRDIGQKATRAMQAEFALDMGLRRSHLGAPRWPQLMQGIRPSDTGHKGALMRGATSRCMAPQPIQHDDVDEEDPPRVYRSFDVTQIEQARS